MIAAVAINTAVAMAATQPIITKIEALEPSSLRMAVPFLVVSARLLGVPLCLTHRGCSQSDAQSLVGMSPPIRWRMASGGLWNHIWYIVISHMKAKHAAINAPAAISAQANG